MGAIFPDVAKKNVLDILLDPTNNPKARLFKNNHVPTPGTDLASLTVADFSGYAEVDLSALTLTMINGAHQGFRQQAGVSFIHNGGGVGNLIYGWYIVATLPGQFEDLMFVERFPAPQSVTAFGDTVQFNLTILDEQGT